ncbi:TPA: hypothetical protein EYO63_26205 [Candidatus Poribacteria bacterium]|nr:hypothetical protein [Candidatus Poribacteria bacterium]HIN28380.1 hypothetical protein [Candidatus Poribacteria bacterium]
MIEIDVVATQAQALQLEHLWVRQYVHQERDVPGWKILGQNTVLSQRFNARFIVGLRHHLASS